MVGENFEIYPSEMAKSTPNHSLWLKKSFEIYPTETAKMNLNHTPMRILCEKICLGWSQKNSLTFPGFPGFP